jgi:dTDP-4-amino-4,6-dideoxygalactose transaminase
MTRQEMIPAAKPLIGAEERAAVDRVMRSGMLAQGPEVAAFEEEFSKLVDGIHCVAVNSGTSALHLALLAIGIQPGDEVLVPSFTFAASANAIALAGGVPVFVDIDPATFCVDLEAAERAVTARTRAIMPVHLYGHPADMTAVAALADRHGLLVVEDAAQAVAAAFAGTPVGTFGDAACFSFYPTKNMTSGEGGMVTTASASVARTLRLLRNQGMERRYDNEVVGFNYRMTDLHAAIGRVQLGKLADWTEQRRSNALFFDRNLRGVVGPSVANRATHVYHQYTIRVVGHDRDEFAAALAARGVGSGVYYPTPVHRLPSFSRRLDLPETERAAAEVLSLPVHPALTDHDLGRIVEAVNDVAAAGS